MTFGVFEQPLDIHVRAAAQHLLHGVFIEQAVVELVSVVGHRSPRFLGADAGKQTDSEHQRC
jgi:hypothetical protein